MKKIDIRIPLAVLTFATLAAHSAPVQVGLKRLGVRNIMQVYLRFIFSTKDTGGDERRRIKRVKTRFSLLTCAVLLTIPCAQSVHAQDWSLLYSAGNLFNSPYFLNSNVGFTFHSGLVTWEPLPKDTPQLARTLDGGRTWTTLPYFDTTYNFITELCFVSPTHGYASTFLKDDTTRDGGIYETSDAGDHWKKITPAGHRFSCVYATKNALFASEMIGGSANGPVWYSYDDGITWHFITSVSGLTLENPPQFQLIYGNRDSLVATVYFNSRSDAYLIFSTDLGTTWHSSFLDSQYEWRHVGLHISPHSCRILRSHIDSSDFLGDTYSFFRASPPYSFWEPSLMHFETSAWIAGNNCAMYSCNANSISPQFQRSIDGGLTWHPVETSSAEKPSFIEMDDGDFKNLAVVGYGSIVYSSDGSDNGFWKTIDGGDGTLTASALAPQLALDHLPFPNGSDTLTLSPCSLPQLIVTNFNIGCSWATFDSVTVGGLDPSEYSVTSTHYCGCTHVPDTSFITLAPTQSGIRNVTVHFHYTDDEYNQIDTTLPVVLDVQSGATPLPMSLTLGSGTMTAHAGDTIVIPVYLTSDSLVTFDTVSMLLPFVLDTNVLKVLGFVPAYGGPVDSLKYEGGTGTVPLQIRDLTISGKTLIGTLRCVVYLADTLQTNVSIAGASINASTGGCVALSTELGGVNIAITGCGDSTLLKFMKTGAMPLAIQSITPNPASNQINILFSGIGQPIAFELIDALGMTRLHGITGGQTLSLNTASLPQGVYFFRAATGDGFAAIREVILQR